MVARLRLKNHLVGKNRVARIMRENGWKAKGTKRYKATTNSKHHLPVAPNLLEQNFTATKGNQKWVSDMTYIWTEEGWLYLAVILELYSRRIVGWSMSERMTAELVCDALKMAVGQRYPPRGVILHSDRGSQYCAIIYQQLLWKHGFICSMSKKGDCYDNAAMESWNGRLKVEAIHRMKFLTREEARREVYYNRKRLHSSLGFLSPALFEATHVA